jgi:hypothetical protein
MCAWTHQDWLSLLFMDGVFGLFDLVALCGCHTLNVCLFVFVYASVAHLSCSMGVVFHCPLTHELLLLKRVMLHMAEWPS